MAPAPTRFGDLELEYDQCLGLRRRLTYSAHIVSPGPEEHKRVVVRFTEEYGELVHQILAAKDLAPRLLYCGPLYKDIIPNGYAGLTMVVMDRSEGLTIHDARRPSRAVYDAVETAIKELHQDGYVHGNVTMKTVIDVAMPAANVNKAHLVNFEHAGKAGARYYSVDLPWIPDKVNRAQGLAPLMDVTKNHDLDHLEIIKQKCSRR